MVKFLMMAVKKLRGLKKKFDRVFTDLGMPVMSGWEVAEKVKRHIS
jgi:CheY-like chemotaxis protein